MNLFSLLDKITKINPANSEGSCQQRSVNENKTSFQTKMALLTLPLAIGPMLTDAYGAPQLPPDIANLLNMMLVLERLEAGLYQKAIEAANLLPNEDKSALQRILADENHHIAFLENFLGTQANLAPTFDYTGGGGSNIGQFRDAFTFYGTFLNVAQALKDISVRAYQGIFPVLYADKALLASVYAIHSVESRHSAHIHQLQYKLGGRPAYPWIWVEDNQHSGLFNTEFYAVYADEENSVQLGFSGLSGDAFDEPMQPVNVKALLNNLFIGYPKLV